MSVCACVLACVCVRAGVCVMVQREGVRASVSACVRLLVCMQPNQLQQYSTIALVCR